FTPDTEGTWVVQAATSLVITALKVMDSGAGTGSARTALTSTNTIAALTPTDFECYSPVTISVTSGAVLPGQGKSLELCNTASAGAFKDMLWAYNPTTQSVARAPYV